MNTLVIQSSPTTGVPSWIARCQASVRDWCEAKGYTWRFIGDEMFDLVPPWYLKKTGRGPVAADYARLKLLQVALDDEGYDQAMWFDADVLVLDRQMTLDYSQSCAFGQEAWIQEEAGGLRVRRNVHNAVCAFRRGCVVLPFLIATVASIIRRADPGHIAPQMVGPKLLSALHSLYGFDLLPQAGALSPAVTTDLARGGGPALALLKQQSAVPLQAVNLCASLIDDETADRVLEHAGLLGFRGLPQARDPLIN